VGAKAMAWKNKSDKYGQTAKGTPKEPCHFLRIKATLTKVTEWLIHTQNREVDKGLFFHLLDLSILNSYSILSTVVAKYKIYT
jgi:hypothetical protein